MSYAVFSEVVMADNCRTLIREILATRVTPSQPHGIAPKKVVRKLAELPDECASELRATARELLSGLPESEEGLLNSVLDALTWRRDPEVRDILLDTLRSRDAMVKEDYVSMLEELDHEDEAPAALLDVLASGREDQDRPDLSVTIRALHTLEYEQAAPSMLAYVSHPDEAARGTAIDFLYEFDDGKAAAPVFADRLAHERDPDIIEMLIDGLVRWGQAPDRNLLRRVAEDPTQPRGLRKSAQRALSLHPED